MYSGIIECFRGGQLSSSDRRRFGTGRSKSRSWIGGPSVSIVDQFDLDVSHTKRPNAEPRLLQHRENASNGKLFSKYT